ncbi:MAG: hypothetical protein OEZ29_02965 [Candidatus Bathyarchaeota archaeon]|nr:hypothetical protein [Candidatus Bathyarchaeota archaeon]MDH5779537.1 hypothetical protein [Candidatus Bathyarchaeota archaeon]
MSEIRTDETQSPDFTHTLNSMLDNLENFVVTFQKALLVMSDKIEEIESYERPIKEDAAPSEKGPDTEEIKQPTNDAITSVETPAPALTDGLEMKDKFSYLKVKFVLGLAALAIGLIAANLALFRWVERTGFYYLLGNYAPYICAYGGFAAMISGAMLINDFLVLKNISKRKYVTDDGITIFANVEKAENKKKVFARRHKSTRQVAVAIPLIVALFLLCPIIVSSILSYTATVVIKPVATSAPEYLWISGNDDFVRKLNKSDPGGPEILSWDTGASQPFGCEYRIEDGNEYIYVVDCATSPDADVFIKFHANNGTEVTRWNISGCSSNPEGLAWNGSRWFIADWVDKLIYQVDPADPTVTERSFSYDGIQQCRGLAWDGSYLWATDFGTDKVYKIDIYGNIQTSWDFTPTDPSGIACDAISGHLWIVRGSFPGYLYEYGTNGTEINNWDPSGGVPQGVAYSYGDI